MLEKWLEKHGREEEEHPSIDYQLGAMAGEYIVATQLPTLSTDMLKTNNVIQVSQALSDKWEEMNERLDILMYDTEHKEAYRTQFYINLEWYKRNIESRYLDANIKVVFPRIEVSNEEAFKEGFNGSLWDSDLSHYTFLSLNPNKDTPNAGSSATLMRRK